MPNPESIKKLRLFCGASITSCKKALEESKNDIATAKKLLNKWGIAKAKDKSSRDTGAGIIFAYVHHNKKVASLIQLACETDFVSGNKDFQLLGNELAMQAASIRAETNEEFLKQEYIRDASKTVNDLIKEAVLKFGENIKLVKFVRWSV